MTSETSDSRRRILLAIRQRYLDRKPLNLTAVKRDDPELVRQVYDQRPYWGWKKALADAGLNYEDIHIEVLSWVACRVCGKRYTVLTQHLARAHELEVSDYRHEYPDAELVSESFRARIIGDTSKMAHPERLPHWEPVYSLEYLLDRLKEYANRGYSLNHDNIALMDSSLPRNLLHYGGFANFDGAIRAIDMEPIDYRGITRDDDFTLADFQAWLADRERQRKSCLYQDVAAERDESRRRPRIVVWAMQRYGNWAEALRNAEVDRSLPVYGNRYILFTAAEVIARIQQLQKEGVNLSRTSVCLVPDGISLTGAAVREFGSWEAALQAAKVPKKDRVRRVIFETQDEVIKEIRKRINNDWSLKPLDIAYCSRKDIELFNQAFRLCGSWSEAVRAAGGNETQVADANETPFRSKAKVVAELKRRARQGMRLAAGELTTDPIDKQLKLAARGFFGSWRAAVRAAGANPRDYHQWNLQPIGKYKSDEEVLDAIRERHRSGLPLNARSLTHGESIDTPLLFHARKHFKSWAAAIKAAHIDYSKIVRKNQDYEAMRGRVYRRYTSKTEVKRELKRRHAAKLPVTYRALVRSNDPIIRDYSLLLAGKKLFGDWDSALRAAGIEPRTVQASWVQLRRERQEQRANEQRRD